MAGDLVVMQASRRPRPTTNPYNVMLCNGLQEASGVRLEFFSWPRAILGRFDVFHVHWPELLVGGHRRSGRAVRQALTALFALRLAVTRRPVVRTVHNLHPPEGLSRSQRALLRALDRLTTLRILINETTPVPDGQATALVLHGDYRPWFRRFPSGEREPGQIAYFGSIRRYKSVDRLLAAFRESDDPRLRLVVAGKPSTPELAASTSSLAGNDPRIELALRFVPDDELVSLVSSSSLVCLPYRHMHNSGSVLAALSLGRPVLVPANDANRRLAEEVGEDWVILFEDELTGRDLEDAVARADALPSGALPDLSLRGWDVGIAGHVEAYRRAAAIRRGDVA
ncbi:glycosyltransferase [Cellulosimicrobium sp. TH-20]|uniref:glycosyltransferase n=1 Tax=Cellulosimicrobium sp. TH-20 TaxID=1980001 RepID=UPI0011A83616|nr:glycosyltransferase [Cellulosimicrobium sp. TH-20]